MFKTVEPDHVKAVKADDGWEEIMFALDSGATETVMGEDMLSGGSREQEGRGVRDCDRELIGEEDVSGRQSRARDPEHHCPGMREEGDASWQPSGVRRRGDVHGGHGHWGKDLGHRRWQDVHGEDVGQQEGEGRGG